MSSEPTAEPTSEPTSTPSLSGEPTPAPTTLNGGESGGAPDPGGSGNWLDSYSPDYRSNPIINKYTGHDEVAKALINANKALSGEKMPVPRDDWSEDQWSEHYQRLGRPADPKDYDIGEFEAPESWGEDFQAELVGVLHKSGANANAVKAALETVAARDTAAAEAAAAEADQQREAGFKDLQNKWGKSFDAQVDVAMRAWRAAAGDMHAELAAMRLENGVALGDDPRIVEVFANIGGKMSEHGLVGGDKQTRTTLTPSEAQFERQKLLGDPEFMQKWRTSNHPEHEWAVNEISSLNQMILAGEQQ